MKSPIYATGCGAAALAAVLVLGGCAAQPSRELAAQDNRKCFYADNVNGFTAVDDDTVNLRVGANDVYQLELLGPCPDVDWSLKIGIQSRGSSWICSGLDATLITPSAIGPQRCPVRTITALTPAQIAALPAGQRP